MKKILLLAGLAVVLLWVTNPDMEDFRPFVREVARTEIAAAAGGGTLGRVLGGAGSELVADQIDRVTERRSYLVGSTYAVDVDGDAAAEWEFLGVATTFVTLQRPGERPEDS